MEHFRSRAMWTLRTEWILNIAAVHHTFSDGSPKTYRELGRFGHRFMAASATMMAKGK
jgi:hypothetical protein